jgi:hypothetical protein
MLKQKYPEVIQLNLFSDGPATQYKQKGNFYLFATEPHKQGFQEVNWNFFEARHSKGAPDGGRGALKRSADRAVHHGKDIPDAQALYTKGPQLLCGDVIHVVEVRSEVTLLPPHTHIHTFLLYSSWLSIEMYKVFVTRYIL